VEVRKLRRRIDLTGETFGNLQVINPAGKNKFGQSLWHCHCSCGNNITIPLCRLRSTNIKSCGRCKPNKHEINGDTVRITVANGVSFIVDKLDYEGVSKKPWYISAQGYVTTDIEGKSAKLHNFLLLPVEGEVIDHINRNKLDNRRKNLRKCTKQQNCFNQSLRYTNTSGFKGVTLDKRRNTYYSRITYDGRTYHLGTFKAYQIIDAAKAYNQKAIELFGEYAFLNPV
jgi:hypothetical protein